MGREIRRVPPGWQHPRKKCEHSPWFGGCSEALENDGYCYQPMHDRVWAEEMAKYDVEEAAWDRGERPEYCDPDYKGSFVDWNGEPPDPAYYRPAWTAEPTHYQVYETVSEGTPLTPVFATQAELVDYLAEHGTSWDQFRMREGKQPRAGWGRENAEAFVGVGWMPSMVMQGGKILEPKDFLKKKEKE